MQTDSSFAQEETSSADSVPAIRVSEPRKYDGWTIATLLNIKAMECEKELSEKDREDVDVLYRATWDTLASIPAMRWHGTGITVGVMTLERTTHFADQNTIVNVGNCADILNAGQLRGVAYVLAKRLLRAGFHLYIQNYVNRIELRCRLDDPDFTDSLDVYECVNNGHPSKKRRTTEQYQ